MIQTWTSCYGQTTTECSGTSLRLHCTTHAQIAWFSVTVQRVHQDSLYFSYQWRKHTDLYYHPVLESMELFVFLVLSTETIHAICYNQVPQCMDHAAVAHRLHLNTTMPTVSSVIFGLPLPHHGETDVTHGPHLMLLMTSSKVDVIL